MIKIKHKGSFKKAEKFLNSIEKKRDYLATLRYYGEVGVNALEEATPKDTGITAGSWSYGIEKTENGYTLYWKNNSRNKGSNIAILLQYGHATGWGAYVKGQDYINPALKDVFKRMADELWREVETA